MTRRDEYRAYLQSPEWQERRQLALARTNGLCQHCGQIATQVHHVKYPKRFEEDHPHCLIPVCDRCHDIHHGVQHMDALPEATQMADISPSGSRLTYLISSGRIYASAQSWARALQVPDCRQAWFKAGLSRSATLKNAVYGGNLEMSYKEITVYRWPVIADVLRAFDREWFKSEFKGKSRTEQAEMELFHNNYERLVEWGTALQERAMFAALQAKTAPPTAASKAMPITSEMLIETIKEAVAPRLRNHDEKLNEHAVFITELQEAVPTMRDQDEFITVKQALSEKGLDPEQMPLHPQSSETLSGLAGQMLKDRKVEQGQGVPTRLDWQGKGFAKLMGAYRRRDIYSVLDRITQHKQHGLPFL